MTREGVAAPESLHAGFGVAGAPHTLLTSRACNSPPPNPNLTRSSQVQLSTLAVGQAYRNRLPAAISEALAAIESAPVKPLSARQADARIRTLAPMLVRTDNRKTWGLLATHIPGWSGRECHDRWVALGKPLLQNQQPTCEGGQKASRWSSILRTMQ